jgi:hypothetical protein
MYDAWALYDDVATPSVADPGLRRPAAERTNRNKNAAVAYAAFHALSDQFPTYQANTDAFTELLAQQGFSVAPEVLASSDTSTPWGLGRTAALSVLADRTDDGANQANNFAEITSAKYPTMYAAQNSDDPSMTNSPGGVDFNPAHWVPLRVPLATVFDPTNPQNPIVDHNDPDSFQVQGYLTPHWGGVRPFALDDSAEFRPVPPPRPGSLANYTDGAGNTMVEGDAYNAQIDEIVQLTANLTEQQKCIAEYWADGPESTTPPGHWNQIALEIGVKYDYGIDDTVKMLFAVNGALLDAGISCWETKRFYDFIRPISAIRHRYFGQLISTWGGPGASTVTRLGEQWIPFQLRTFVTPPFAEYTSGHSTFSGAASEVLRTFAGSDEFYDGVTRADIDYDGDGQLDLIGEFNFQPGTALIDPSLPSTIVRLRWNTLTEAANEAGLSRRFGGIHFQDGDLRARQAGRAIGGKAFSRASALWNGGAQ